MFIWSNATFPPLMISRAFHNLEFRSSICYPKLLVPAAGAQNFRELFALVTTNFRLKVGLIVFKSHELNGGMAEQNNGRFLPRTAAYKPTSSVDPISEYVALA